MNKNPKKLITFLEVGLSAEKERTPETNSAIKEKIQDLPLYDLKLMGSDSESYYFSKWCYVQSFKYKKVPVVEKTESKGTNLFDVFKERFKNLEVTEAEHFSTMLYFSMYNELSRKIATLSEKRTVYPSEVIKWEESLLKKWKKASFQLEEMVYSNERLSRGVIFKVFPYLELHVRNNKIIFADDLLTAEIPLTGNIPEPELLMNIVELNYKTEKDFKDVIHSYMIPSFHHPVKYKGKKVDVHIGTRLVKYSFVYYPKTGKYTRMNGQEIYTFEGIVYEIKEMERRSTEDRIQRMKTAYEMFASTLNDAQDKMLRETGLVLLEGDRYYYFASAEATNSYLCRFKKNGAIDSTSIEKMEAMCIHPDGAIPVFDGMASINLHLMSGEESYVTKNANVFPLYGTVRKQVENFFEKLEEKQLGFNGLQTLEGLY